ncbi:MAG: cytochrome c biogenesis protein CcsA [Planctomycetia bacterium]
MSAVHPLLHRARPAWQVAGLLALSLALAVLPSPALAGPEAGEAAAPGRLPSRPRWDPEALRVADTLPLQAGGRVKPLITFAGYTLLGLSGRKSVTVVEGGVERTLGPTEWFLDVLFFPQHAATYRVFLVTDDAALDAIGFTREMREQAAREDAARDGGGPAMRKKRDRWSLSDLAPAEDGLRQQAMAALRVEPRERTRTQQQVLSLWQAWTAYHDVATSWQLATGRLEVPSAPAVTRIVGEGPTITFTQAAARLQDLLSLLPARNEDRQPSEDERAVARLVFDLERLAGSSDGPGLLAPAPGAEDATWANPWRLLQRAAESGEPVDPRALGLLAALERVGDSLQRPAAALDALRSLRDGLVGAAEARGEHASVPLEVRYQRLDPVRWAWVLSMVGLALSLLGLLSVAGRFGAAMRGMAWLVLLGGAGLLVAGIVMRCIIRQRPPVSTLYETVLFIAATGMIVAFAAEGLTRRRFGLPLAGVTGTLGLLLAQWFESLNRQDTMPTLEAVLDTNFWLATHVTTVTFGYSAGLLAALLGQAYVFGKVLGVARDKPDAYAALGRMVYGVIAFGLLLSIVGTILGGIWANDSWGRFWGWDPKENGALMIVLWELVMLHARLGGYVGPFGFSMLAIGGGAVVAWSWWGVNQLGVGLHSYGFTEGIQALLDGIYAVVGGSMAVGLGWWLLRRPDRARPGA